ncbi:hypothetical protein TEHN7126_2113 [Tetragenococcus halophilus subsp. halophilus]|uniref:DUF6941 family protein n=1 Tax=Tetragenococcus halophilus TaxID=51669 RepID=UPI000CC736B4|nr:hypothetical protein [Tetragenococcus halophilus]GBD74008.1 hypothetical protein TEHN7125_2168 [Tetragenococcus halophilus subsp. halophilus]GBD76414.1 hypothetical protein TEHN7126_2113 [Tetragenococcus halophilus subsp. halophilus]
MTKIANFICIEDFKNDENGNLNLIEPLVNVVLKNLPNNYSFGVVFSLLDISLDMKKEHSLKLELSGPEGKKLYSSGNVKVPLKDDNEENIDNLTANFKLGNVEFNEEGLHTVKITIDDEEELSESTYFVVKAKK